MRPLVPYAPESRRDFAKARTALLKSKEFYPVDRADKSLYLRLLDGVVATHEAKQRRDSRK